MNQPAVVHEVFSGATLTPHDDPSVIYKDTKITAMDEPKKYRFQATQIVTVKLITQMHFEEFFTMLSEKFKSTLLDRLSKNELPDQFHEHVRADLPVWFKPVNALVWCLTLTSHTLRPETFSTLVVQPGIYDTGERQEVDFIVNSNNLYNLRTVSNAETLAKDITTHG